MSRTWSRAALCAFSLLLLGPVVGTAQAEPTLPPGSVQATQAAAPPVEPPSIDDGKRDELLGPGWQESGDLLWTTSGDAEGFHLLTAEARTGYTWRTTASLRQPGLPADQWIGNACVTGSGKRAVVVYAPRTFTNDDKLANRGGYTAVVDLASGAVTELPVRTSLAYFNPGCGAGDVVALTQGADTDLGKTGVFTLDTATGALSGRTELRSQLTSAVPTPKGLVVAAAGTLALVGADGKLERLTPTRGVAYNLTPDADGGVVYAQGADKDGVEVRRFPGSGKESELLATGRTGEVGIARGTAGRVFLTGKPAKVEKLPRSVTELDVDARAEVSTSGEAAVTGLRASGKATLATQPVHIAAKSTKTGRDLGFTVNPADNPVRGTGSEAKGVEVRQPPANGDATTGEVGITADDPDSLCSVPRNDPAIQVMQPKPKQVEWAADMAIEGGLTIQRPANWHSNGLPAYSPQGLFPPRIMTGKVPAQVMLGILGQESNLWQASRYIMPGDYGNPLIGNYYGLESYDDDPDNDWIIRPEHADCGYGVSQMTDGMRRGGSLSSLQQKAVATDYAAAIAAGMQLLQDKWIQLQAAGVRMNDNDPSKIENWFAAAWAYNSGYHPPGEEGSNGAHGLGWVNNPANPRYPEGRAPFGKDPRDFAKPQQWPYPERVMGFAANPPSGYEAPGVEVPFFRAAWWNSEAFRDGVKPSWWTFCDPAKNSCSKDNDYLPNHPDVVGEPAGPCGHKSVDGYYDLKCWWHDAVSWKDDCPNTCGNEFIRYDYPAYANAEPADGTSYPPTCGTAGLPTSALVVDDIPRLTPPVRNVGCKRTNFADGTFQLTFGRNAAGQESGKIALQQSGGGYGSHFYFTDLGIASDVVSEQLAVSARWTLGQVLTSPAEVWVNRPMAMEDSRQSIEYVVDTANGPLTVNAVWPGTGDKWINLGTFPFNGKPSVSVSSLKKTSFATPDKIAFDAVAFVPAEASSGKVAKITSHANLCLAPQGSGVDSGVPAVQRTCTGDFAEKWAVNWITTYTDANGLKRYVYQFRNENSGKCLEVPDNRTDVGAPVQQANCVWGAYNQQWASGSTILDINGKNDFANRNSGLYMGLAGCNTTPGAPVQQIPFGLVCNNDAYATTWRFSFLN
ncbi:RICIN domain-containing protein [Saccharothrix sp. NRRL B-16314]|uniref:RICIN domain-containing protein n=1 Tax=Saccharothrix sp. NRRL B-16314 TaxID=1463825 RepID=UPI00068B0955|nr:RICIN domain-containing protein [Saccharothrix sp. NRRL B-16314]